MTTTMEHTMTAADRCDRCGAQAFIKAVMSGGLELRFCGHHGREHLPRLRHLAEIEDHSASLQETTPTAPADER